MNKYNRDKHIKAMHLIEEAAFEIPRLIREGKTSEVPDLLADCQGVAIALGGHIEKLYGLQTQTVAVLEEYCNALYNVSISMDEASLIALAEAIELMQATYDIEFPEKKEIVFMPYKASMWDSLESVWMAAKEDEGCEVYVVPIPYYDRTENRGFEELHYEGDSFPHNVAITYYEDYDIELHHPDIVYIHNPYDDCNLVTSVAPKYYSKKLKNYTDKLIYIPYFVVEDNVRREKIEHYAYLPAVIHADKVIVQSEKVKEYYVDALTKKVAGISKSEWEERILGLGSPKFDAVHKYSKDTVEIPDEWKEIIGDKKVVLYNTHLNLLMKWSGDLFLKKLRKVIEVFKNKEGVVLWWRPHPLMISTAKAMNPDVVEEFLKIVNEYRENNYGIYDDSADVHRAIAISDAFYGSPSSMLHLYKETGKPVLIHDLYMDVEI